MQEFTFKQFTIRQDLCAMKVGTDGVLLGAWADGGKYILDIGTGTGLIALMMAQRFPDALIHAIDIEHDASAQAIQNVMASSFADRISVKESSLQAYNSEIYFDSITCNPPFFEENLKCPDKKRNTARHTDTLPYSLLFSRCRELLSDDGVLNIIIPTDYLSRIEQECAFESMFVAEYAFIRTTEKKRAKRTLLKIKKHHQVISRSEHTLMENNTKSSWYKQITEDFYL